MARLLVLLAFVTLASGASPVLGAPLLRSGTLVFYSQRNPGGGISAESANGGPLRQLLTGVEDINFIRFGGEDVVRHKLVQRIVEAYKAHAEQTGTLRSR